VVVHGEAEETIAGLLGAWETGAPLQDVAGLSFLQQSTLHRTAERPPLEQFESLPIPDFGLLRYARIKIYPVNRIRGCAMRCEFCTVKGRARCASPERLVEQFSRLAETYGARRFFIVDDQFAQDREETLRFCRLLSDYQRRLQLRFDIFAQIRLSHARDQELLDAMRACGIRILAIGYESVVDDELRAMGKGQRTAEMLELTRRYQRNGFIIHGMFIFGYPLDSPAQAALPSVNERVKQTRRFLRKARLDTVQVLHAVPLPGTRFRERLQRQGRIFPLQDVGWEYYDGNFQLIEPDPPATALELQDATLRIMRGEYRFTALFSIAWRILTFPFAMLPLWSLRSRWSRWSRSWRRTLLEFAGWSLMRRWKKRFREAPYRQKVLNAKPER
jgi:radical SAM superfamily enzyme YgiQ (UPF0313 family)